MTETLSVVEFIWNLPASWLDYNLYTLSNQTQPPLEIIVTNSSSDDTMFDEATKVCAKYPLVRMVEARRERLNLSHSINVAIRASRGTYVMMTNMDRLFAPNLLEGVYDILAPNRMITCHTLNLPMGLDLGSVDTIFDRWDSVVAQADAPKTVHVGSIICVEREWFVKVHGFDENRCPLLYADSDLILRGGKDGWDDTRYVSGDIVLHIGHPSRISCGYGGKYPDQSLPVVRNPNGWGEV